MLSIQMEYNAIAFCRGILYYTFRFYYDMTMEFGGTYELERQSICI
jgi:hypothetical protein